MIASLLVVLPVLAAFAAPRPLEGWAVAMGAGVALVIVAALSLPRPPARLSRQVMVALGIAGAAAAWLVARSLLAANPRVSLQGMFGAGDGALLWLVAWGAFAAATFAGSVHTLSAVRAAIALTAAVAAIAGLMDFAGLIPHPDFWAAEAAGLLGTSNSLGQLLVLGLGASISWALARASRWYGLACAVACLVGLAVSESRAAIAAAVIAGVVVTAIALIPAAKPRAIVGGGAAALLAVAIGTALTWLPRADGALAKSAASILSDRPAVWGAAHAQIGQAPLLGSGSQMFSAYYDWGVDPTRVFGVETIGTFSPHSLALDWLLAGGAIGASVALAALAAAVRIVVGQMAKAPRVDAAWPLVGGLFAWLLASMVGVVEAPALLTASALGGSLLAIAGERDSQLDLRPDGGLERSVLPASVAFVGLVAVAVLLVPYATGTRAVAWDPRDVGPEQVPRYADAYSRTGDPAFVTMGLSSLLAQTGGEYPDALARDARSLARLAQGDASWQVDVARLGAAAEALRSTEDSSTQLERVDAFLGAGSEADPRATVWDALSKREAKRLGSTP